jgi:predicted nucleic acid-binding protein
VILVDTSVWVDHLRRGDAALEHLLDTAQVMSHPLVIGEIAMGNLRDRALVLGDLAALPIAMAVSDQEVLGLIERRALHGLGLGYVDACLLASTQLTPDARLWTRDRRLEAAARQLGVAV